MSIIRGQMTYTITNGLTNEVIKVPKISNDTIVMKDISIADLLLYQEIKAQLMDTDRIIVSKSYMNS